MKLRHGITDKKNKILTQTRKIRELFAGSDKWFRAASLLFFSMAMGSFLSALVKTPWMGWIAGVLLALPAGLLLSALAGRIFFVFVKGNGKSLFWTMADLALLYFLAYVGSVGAKQSHILITVLLQFLSMTLFVKSMFLICRKGLRNAAVLLLASAAGGVTVFFVWFLAAEGFADSYEADYLIRKQEIGRQTEWALEETAEKTFETYGENGRYTVETLCYSNEESADLQTKPVDLSRYVMEGERWQEWYRDFFQSYDLTSVPVAGKIWYPKETADCPILFMVHGNHSITEASYLGYEYLGEYFASLGYVFVSVDENALNERSGENDGRAILLLENIKSILQFAQDEENPLYQKLDRNAIGLAGHSRGGEMIADAYLFSQYENYPSNGMFELDYPFKIQALLAIAPTYGQYEPADHEVEITDVNYMVIQGANDQDVSVFMGSEQYENVSFSGNGNYVKSSLYFAGGNHGQFNTLWGRYDITPPFSRWLNTKNLISQEEQQYLLKVFSRAFFDAVLKGDTTCESLLYHVSAYEKYLPQTLYAQQFDTSKAILIADYEEDSDVMTASDGSECDAANMSMWTEERICDSAESRGERENHGLYLKWDNTKEAYYEIDLAKAMDISKGAFCFDICNLTEEISQGEGILDFTVRFTDADGNCAYARIGELAALYPAYPVRLSKIQYLFSDSEWKYPFQTVSIQREDLICGEAFQQNEITNITFVFDKCESGKLWIDQIRCGVR